MPFPCARGAYARNEEPTLDELLSEPMVRLLMARDGVQEADFRQLFSSQDEFICSQMHLAADEGRFQELANWILEAGEDDTIH